MKVFLCGIGDVAFGAFGHLMAQTTDIALFTHDSQPRAAELCGLGTWTTKESVNDMSIWPFLPDMIISVYYRYIIKKHVIDAVGDRIFNAHPSLLPLHRGCSSLPWSIIEGDTHTGITYHYIDQGIDTGPIILQAVCQIDKGETQASLSTKINTLAIHTFPMAFDLACWGHLGYPQQGHSSYHKRQVPYNREIDPDWDGDKIQRFINAMIYPPYPPALYKSQEIYTMNQYLEMRYK